MLKRLFPDQIDNRFTGLPAGAWLFYPLVFVRLGISISSLINPIGSMQGADGIPLSSYSPAAAQALIGVGAYLDFADLLLGLMFLLAAVRYRSMIPLMFSLIILDWVGHRVIGAVWPIARTGASPGGVFTLTIFAMSVIGLILSLIERRPRSKI
jgi:hypothetical protein